MQRTALGICGLVVIGLGAAAFAQTYQGGRKPAPTTEAIVWTIEEQNGHMKELIASPTRTNWPFFQEETFNTEMRTLKGKQPALVHGKRADLMIIRDGSGTFTTGGELIGGKPYIGIGDYSGTEIKGGISKVVKPGDVVYIPPGVPHYFSDIPNHVTQLLVRWDAR